MTIAVMKSVAGTPPPPSAGTPKRTLLGVGFLFLLFVLPLGVVLFG